MNASEFEKELEKILDETNDRVVSLVHKTQQEDGLEWDTDKPVSWANSTLSHNNWEGKADGFALIAGWIHDRLNGRTRLSKKSMSKKIRKALGYTYP